MLASFNRFRQRYEGFRFFTRTGVSAKIFETETRQDIDVPRPRLEQKVKSRPRLELAET